MEVSEDPYILCRHALARGYTERGPARLQPAQDLATRMFNAFTALKGLEYLDLEIANVTLKQYHEFIEIVKHKILGNVTRLRLRYHRGCSNSYRGTLNIYQRLLESPALPKLYGLQLGQHSYELLTGALKIDQLKQKYDQVTQLIAHIPRAGRHAAVESDPIKVLGKCFPRLVYLGLYEDGANCQ